MSISITGPSNVPSLSDPSDFFSDIVSLADWASGSLITQLEETEFPDEVEILGVDVIAAREVGCACDPVDSNACR